MSYVTQNVLTVTRHWYTTLSSKLKLNSNVQMKLKHICISVQEGIYYTVFITPYAKGNSVKKDQSVEEKNYSILFLSK